MYHSFTLMMNRLFSLFVGLTAAIIAILFIFIISGGASIAGLVLSMNRKHEDLRTSMRNHSRITPSTRVDPFETIQESEVACRTDEMKSNEVPTGELPEESPNESLSDTPLLIMGINNKDSVQPADVVPTGYDNIREPFTEYKYMVHDIQFILRHMNACREHGMSHTYRLTNMYSVSQSYFSPIEDTIWAWYCESQNTLYITIDGTFNTTQAREGLKMYAQDTLCSGISAHSGLLRAYKDLRIRSSICGTILQERLSGRRDAKIVIAGYSRGAAFAAFFAAEEARAARRVVHGDVRFILCACPKIFDPISSSRLRMEEDYARRVLVVNHVSDIIPQLPLGITDSDTPVGKVSISYAPMSQTVNCTIQLYKCPMLSANSASNSMRKIHSLLFYIQSLEGPYRLVGTPIVEESTRDPKWSRQNKITTIDSFLFARRTPRKLKSD